MKSPLFETQSSRHTLFQQMLPLDMLSRTLRVQPEEWKILLWVTTIQLVMSSGSILINNVAQTTFIKRFGVDALPIVFMVKAMITFWVAGMISMLMERYRSLRVFTGLLLVYGAAAGVIRVMIAAGMRMAYPLLFILKSQAVGILPILVNGTMPW